METERARSSSLEKQFSEQLEELRMEGTEAALRGAGQDLTTLLAAERLKVIELEKTMDNLKAVRKSTVLKLFLKCLILNTDTDVSCCTIFSFPFLSK